MLLRKEISVHGKKDSSPVLYLVVLPNDDPDAAVAGDAPVLRGSDAGKTVELADLLEPGVDELPGALAVGT
jgi:hypothetical protein